MKYILLSYTINKHTPLYGNTPSPEISAHSRIVDGDSSNTCTLFIHNHTGTHIDAPKHFIDNGKSIFEYSLEYLVFKNPLLVDCPKNDATLIMPEDLQKKSHAFQNSDCLLLRTGFGQFRNEERYRTHNPGIAPDTILWIRTNYPNVRCIGIDAISISSFQNRDAGRAAHKMAFMVRENFGEPLLLIEDMNLNALSSNEIKHMIVIPWQVEDVDSAPCSILGEIE